MLTFFWILLPIFSIFVVGFISQKMLHFDIPNLSKMSIYVLSPFLAFKTFYSYQISIDYLYYFGYIYLLCFALVLLVSLASKLFNYDERTRCGMILGSSFMNNGNYGTPVVLAFFGAAGFDLAIIMLVLQQVVMNTVGTYYAAKGSSRHIVGSSVRHALYQVLKMPTAHGALLGVLFQLLQIPLSESLYHSISMVGDASIVVIMVILGMQLANIRITKIAYGKLSINLTIKMLLSPLIALFLVEWLPIDHTSKQVLILLAAMPAAANTTLLAVHFDTKPELVSSATLISTLISLITLPIVLYCLGVELPTA
ncbi:AEC family transporter [Ignatzschineria cameli]|uniref:AEC family transporter n=1 Tax=Ignatzschineria cameli TaxID=2182793 RepID=UPI001EFD43D3|nr:AEC family transporter [Ignatzschineria cameli]